MEREKENTGPGGARRVRGRGHSILAAGGAVGAVLASSCCLIPLALALAGVSGAWIGRLTALAPYRPWIVGATMILLALGFWRAYFVPAQRECAPGSYCAQPRSSTLTKGILWAATGLVLLAASVDYWTPLFY